MKESPVRDLPVVAGKIGIATVLFNSGDVLPDFFRSLKAQTYDNFVVYAVDNASTDGSAAFCRGQGDRFVVTENHENTGFAHGTNQGIQQALGDGCDAVLILNNDVVFESNFLNELMHSLELHHADMAAPLTYYADRPDVIWAAGGKLQRFAGYRPVHLGMDQKDAGQFSSNCRIQFAPGSCILAKADVFARIGVLDEAYFTYWEDTDFAVRALKAGLYTLFVPTAKLWHKVSSLTGVKSPFQRYYAVRNHALYISKHCSPLHARLLSAFYLLWYRLAGLRKGTTDPRVAVWKEGLQLAGNSVQDAQVS
jgi:GT2 family glycosyltransferase